jgi:hypothetical protein
MPFVSTWTWPSRRPYTDKCRKEWAITEAERLNESGKESDSLCGDVSLSREMRMGFVILR